MKRLDENGVLVPAEGALFCAADSRALAQWLCRSYPCVSLEQTNMAPTMRPFLFTVLANAAPGLLGDAPDYLRQRETVEELAAAAQYQVDGFLLLDEGAGHALYLAQPRGQRGSEGAFGRSPIRVYFEHQTGTVLCENSVPLAALLHTQAETAKQTSGDGLPTSVHKK